MDTTATSSADLTRESAQTSAVTTSVVLPAYNEAGNIADLVAEILAVFDDNAVYRPVEVIVVDDGSTDGTRETILDLAAEHEEVVGVLLSRNFGQSAALNAGIEQATGKFVVTMDADRQNDPADVPRLLDELTDGYDCVSGWRRDRQDPITKTVPSDIQTRLARLTGPDIHDFGCTLKAYRSEALNGIHLYGEGHRYIPAQLYNRGYRITELPVNHRPRTAGSTKYGTKRLVKGLLDLLFHVFWNRFSTRPIHFLGGFGLLSSTVGFLIGTHLVVQKYAFGLSLTPRLPRLILTVALVLFGLILIMFGFLAEMLTMLHYSERTPYRIATVTGRSPTDGDGLDAPAGSELDAHDDGGSLDTHDGGGVDARDGGETDA